LSELKHQKLEGLLKLRKAGTDDLVLIQRGSTHLQQVRTRFPSFCLESCNTRCKRRHISSLTKEALNVGTDTKLFEAFCTVITVIAPGGNPVAICKSHVTIARRHRFGVARKLAVLKTYKGLDRSENKSSIVETFMLETRRRCQRYWTNARDKEHLKAKPKALAEIFDAVDMYDCGAARCRSSASFPFRRMNRTRWAPAMRQLEYIRIWTKYIEFHFFH
jgi:hypothetical protein